MLGSNGHSRALELQRRPERALQAWGCCSEGRGGVLAMGKEVESRFNQFLSAPARIRERAHFPFPPPCVDLRH